MPAAKKINGSTLRWCFFHPAYNEYAPMQNASTIMKNSKERLLMMLTPNKGNEVNINGNKAQ